MKRILKVGGITILILVILLIFVPFLFKGKINTLLQKEANKQLNAHVDWKNLSVSLLRDFPNFTVGIEDFNITGLDTFKTDTLLYVEQFNLSVDLASVISGDQIEINSIALNDILVNAIALNDSVANWDIVKSTESNKDAPNSNTANSSSNMAIALNQFKISNADIFYKDYEANRFASIKGLNTNISANVSSSLSDLIIHSTLDKAAFKQDDIVYLNDIQVGFDAVLGADFDKQFYSFKDNILKVNDLELAFDGDVQMLDNGYDMNLILNTQNNEITSLLSMLPEMYRKDIDGVKTKGKISLAADAKGIYIDENQLPAFDLTLKVEDGLVKYASLPSRLEDLNVLLEVNNPGGLADSTKVQLKSFHFVVENNPFDAGLWLSTPVSNPEFSGMLKGTIDLASLKRALPSEEESSYQGTLSADVNFSGDMNKIDQEQYDQLNMNGDITIQDIKYKSSDLPTDVYIPTGQLTISSKEVKLKDFICTMGQSDFELDGYLNNYLGYLFSDKKLYGKLNHHSKYINVNQFLVQTSASSDTSSTDTTQEELVEVPKNIDLVFTSSIDKILYDKLLVSDTKGSITVKEGAVNLDGLHMNLLDGKMVLTGVYNTQNTTKPFVDFTFNANNINIKKTAQSFSVVDSLMPVAKNADGNLSAKLKYYSLLNEDMSANISSITGNGTIESESITVSNSKVLNQMADLLKKDKYRTLKAEDINIDFVMADGKIKVEPFTTKVYDSSIKVSGEQGFDQSLNYVIEVPVSRQDVANAMGFLGAMVNPKGEDIMVDVIIKGYANDPKMSLDLAKAQKQLQKEVSKETKEAVDELMKDENVKKAVDDIKKKLGGFFK